MSNKVRQELAKDGEGLDEHECRYCHAWKHASQLRWHEGEPVCLYCWMKFNNEAKWYGLDKIGESVERQDKQDYEMSSEIMEGPGDYGVVLND